jgi:hypothetical protein
VKEEGLTLASPCFFPSRSLVLLTCLSNAELIIFLTSLREDDGLGRTSGITLDLVKMIGVVSLRTVPCGVTSQRFKRLAALLRQGVEGGLEDIVLVEIGSVVIGVSTLHT